MTLSGLQLLIIPFSFFLIYVSFIHYKKGLILKESFIFWLMLWICVIILSIAPEILEPLVSKLKFFRVLDLVMIIAFMILTLMYYSTYISLQSLKKTTEKLIEKLTVIKDLKNSK